MFAMYFIGFAVFLFCASMVGIGVYGAMEEKRIYEQKVAARNLVIQRQTKERADKEQKERDNYAKGSN